MENIRNKEDEVKGGIFGPNPLCVFYQEILLQMIFKLQRVLSGTGQASNRRPVQLTLYNTCSEVQNLNTVSYIVAQSHIMHIKTVVPKPE